MIQLKKTNFRKNCRSSELHEYYKKIRFQLILLLNAEKQIKISEFKDSPIIYIENDPLNNQKQNQKLGINQFYQQKVVNKQKRTTSDSQILNKLQFLVDQMQQIIQKDRNNEGDFNNQQINKIMQKCIKVLVLIDRHIQDLNTTHFKNYKQLKQEIQQVVYTKQVGLLIFKDAVIKFLYKNKQQNINVNVSQVLMVWLLLYLPTLQQLTQIQIDSAQQLQQYNQNQKVEWTQDSLQYTQQQYRFESRKSLMQLDRLTTIQLMLQICQVIEAQKLVQILNGQYCAFSLKVTQTFQENELLTYGLQKFIIENIQGKYAFLQNIYKNLSLKSQEIHNQTLKQTIRKLQFEFQKYKLQLLQNQISTLVLQQQQQNQCQK